MFYLIDQNQIPNICCIYRWRNTLNKKVYIGETKDLFVRIRAYRNGLLRKVRQDKFSRALRKYGFENFKLEIIEQFPTGTPKTVLLLREKFWIQFFDSTNRKIGYNSCEYGSVMKNRPYRVCLKIKKANVGRVVSQETRIKIGLANKGMKRSDELKKAMSNHRIGKPGHKHTEETKAILSQKHTGKRKDYVAKAILQIDKNTGEVIEEFKRITDAALKLTGKNNISGISLAASGKKKSAYGFFWRFKNA